LCWWRKFGSLVFVEQHQIKIGTLKLAVGTYREIYTGKFNLFAQVRSGITPPLTPCTTMLYEPDVDEELLPELFEQAHDWALANGIVIMKKGEPGCTNPDIYPLLLFLQEYDLIITTCHSCSFHSTSLTFPSETIQTSSGSGSGLQLACPPFEQEI
jgi:hypothetical protein